jgi:hypothetical protein
MTNHWQMGAAIVVNPTFAHAGCGIPNHLAGIIEFLISSLIKLLDHNLLESNFRSIEP